MGIQIISSLPPVREEIPHKKQLLVKTRQREVVNGTIYVRRKDLTYDDYLILQPDASDFKLDALVEAGVTPQMVNPVILRPTSAEFSAVDKDDVLQTAMDSIESQINNNEVEVTPDVDTSDTQDNS